MFARPSKQIPGKWHLVEYYVETGDELKNIDEARLKAGKEFWDIQFTIEKNYTHQCNLPVTLVSVIENGTWSISKNYITFIHPMNFRNNVEFQFAIEKETLKMLKKDAFGRIEFFGFFRKMK